jgi:CRP-like cAMP-binding protein
MNASDTTAETAAVLGRVPMLAHLERTELESLARLMTPVDLASGDVLFHEGLPGGAMAVLMSGSLKVRARGHGGDAMVGNVYPGEIVGEMSCIDPAPRSASVVAGSKAQVLCLTGEAFTRLEDKTPQVTIGIRNGILRQLAVRIRQTNERIDRELARRGIVPPTAPEPSSEVDGVAMTARLDLRKVSSLKSFTVSELKTLVQLAPPRSYPRGRVLCREGEVGRSAWILASGTVDVSKRIRREECHLATLPAGAMVGQFALIDDSPRSATVTVSEDAVLLRIARDPFQQLLRDLRPFAIRFQHQIAISGVRQLRQATERLATLLTSAVDRSRLDALDTVPLTDQLSPTQHVDEDTIPTDATVRQLSLLRAATGNWGIDLVDETNSAGPG